MSTLEKIKYNRITRSPNYTWRCPNWKNGACHKGNAVCFEIDQCEAYHRLEEIEDKIENGSAFIFPVRLGEELYFVGYNDKEKKYTVTPIEVTSFINISTDERLVEWEIGIYPPVTCWGKEISISTVRVNNIGKTVFASRKEAEAKAKEYNDKGAFRIIDGVTVPIHFIEE